jgi:DNA-binding winged helix-turn-helix (wHTH) protein
MAVHEVGPFHLRTERLTLMYSGRAVPIGPKVVETLLGLIESAGEAVSKEALMERVWPNRFVEESNLAQNVYVLRKIFRRYGGGAHDIETIPGFGYRLTAATRRVADVPKAPQPRLRRPRIAWAIASAALVLMVGAFASRVENGGQRIARTALSDQGARLYSLGRYYWNSRTAAGVEKSMEYFTLVIDRDPQSPLGYVGMADANESMGDYCYGTHRPSVYFARARAFAAKALLLDPESAPVHATLGFIALHEHRDAAAVTEFRRAIAIDPSYAAGHEWYGIALARENRVREGWQQLSLASQLDPISVSTMTWLSRLAYRDGRPADADTYEKEALEMSPGLAARRSPAGHPTWASVEDTIH